VRHVAIGLCRRPTDGALLLEHGYDRVAGLRFYRAIGGACECGEGPPAWEGVDPEGLRHSATWVLPATGAAALPVYPAGVLDLLRGAG
jgi:hypothetical protein